MNTHMSEQELMAVEKYLEKAANGELIEEDEEEYLSKEELEFVLPSIRKLIHYGAVGNEKLQQKDRPYDYAFMYKEGENDPMYTYTLVFRYAQIIGDLLTKYKKTEHIYAN